MRVKTLVAVTSVAAIALLATAVAFAAGGASKHHAKAKTVKVSSRSVSGLGKILVDSKGRTLYMFAPDKRKKVTCHAVCAKIWPPLFVPAGAKLVAAGGVKQALLKSDKDSTGGRVATYNGWPLYLYLGDRKAGDAAGQAVNMNGGLWYVMSVSGAVLKAKPGASSGGGGGSATGGGSGSGSGSTTTTPGGGNSQCSDDDGDGDGTAGGPDDGDGCI